MDECIAYDDDGSIMTCYTLNTIAPIEYARKARELSLFHLMYVDKTQDRNVEAMLPTKLYNSKGELTHIMCARPGYNNTVRSQMATVTAENLNGELWVSDTFFYLEDKPDIELVKSRFCLVLGDFQEFITYLGLEAK